MTSDAFLPCAGAPFETLCVGCEVPCAIVSTPFTGASAAPLTFCDGAETPAGVGGFGVAVFVAVAYERTGSCAGTVPDSDEVESRAAGEGLDDCCTVLCCGGTAVVISDEYRCGGIEIR